MSYTEADLKAKTVKDLKEIAKEVGAPAGGRKEELIAAILASCAAAGEELDDAGLGDVPDDLGVDAGADEAAAGLDGAAPEPGKHSSIVFALDTTKQAEAGKKANIVGVKVLSDAERAQLRAAKFGLATKGGVSKPAAAGSKPAAGGGISSAGGVGVGLEEEIKKLQRAEKFGKLSEADEKKLQGLQRKLEAQKAKQQLALDKVEMTDPNRMAEREKKFGKSILKESKNPKDPELMKKRAEKFGKVIAAGASAGDDDARKKARLERFAKDK